MNEIIKAAKSLLADIEDMSSSQTQYAFGPFEVYDDGECDVFVEWPNLEISANILKKQISEYEKSSTMITGFNPSMVIIDEIGTSSENQ